MQYKNKKTGGIINTPFVISGGDWVAHVEKTKKIVEEAQKEQEDTESVETEPVEQEAVVEESEEASDNVPEEITKAQIMQELDAFGVKYNPRDKKQVLYDLMIAQGK
ncbi:hypothetical protein [Lactococcus formosensis]|uniref:hypothetical protein n=1 Tax=Lactococcus formosensis TaxID=1281486 RepID=UPI0024358E92|nr:hypothetical protein [Lactococcus formosensis]MDG6113754.1 hypothetical protein [Lactococcus formosensis]MDG6122255.1 hypothetical protein [Lactococcus formosensis]MDG6151861.1 hypothetical protein [Lactococcus formosensis]MDG6174919.1 hypothetical protein [Lactococcus formosensis]MDG6181237.1 hypothetical protein [Lactococcus formosensis]